MSITLDQLQALGDPLVEGPLDAKYLGTRTYLCKRCRQPTGQVIVVLRKPTSVHGKQPVNLCLTCYYDPGRRYDWGLHS